MSENLSFAVTPITQESSNSLLIHENIKKSQDEHLVSGSTQNVNLNKDIVSSLTTNWYQNDLAHMTTNLMRGETNLAATALSTTLSPNMMARSVSFNDNVYGNPGGSASFNDNVYGNYLPINPGGIDLSSLGTSNNYRNKDNYNQIETDSANRQANYYFNLVLDRSPNADELKNAMRFVYADSTQDQKLHNKLATSQEAHDRIVNMGIDVLGYTPSEEWIQQEQAKLATFYKGKGPYEVGKYIGNIKDIRKDFANSQAAYNSYSNMAKNMLGHNVDEATVRNMQNQVINGSKYTDIQSNLAYSSTAREVAVNMLKDMGVNPSEQDIKWTQDRFREGKSAQWVLSEHAHGYHGREVAINMLNNVGTPYSDSDIIWSQDRLGEGKSAQWVFHEHTQGYLGDAAADDVYYKLTGNHLTAADQSWRNMAKDRIYDQGGKQKFFYNEVYGPLGTGAINQVTSTIYGEPVNEATVKFYQANLVNGWLKNIQDVKTDFIKSQAVYDKINQVTSTIYGEPVNEATVKFYQANLLNGWLKNIQDVKTDFAHSKPVRQASIDMMQNMGFTPSEQDITWTQDQLVNKSFQSVIYEHAQGYHGREVAIKMMTNMGFTPSEQDIKWTQDQLGAAKSAQSVIYEHAQGYHGHDMANKIFKTVTGRDMAASDAGWENNIKNNLGKGTSYKNVLHQEVYGSLGTSAIQQMAKNKGITLTQTAIRAEQDLVEKQGLILTQQQFNLTYDIYRSMVDTANEIDMNRFLKYQTLVQQGWNDRVSLERVIARDEMEIKGESASLVFHTNDGKAVLNYKGEVVHYPAGAHNLIIKIVQTAGQNRNLFTSVNPAQLYYYLGKFAQGQEWDIQRLYVSKGIDPRYRDISTIAIGMFGAAAGIPEGEILRIEDTYAWEKSKFTFTKEDPADVTYTHLPKLNVENTKKGYEIYNNNQFGN